MGGGGGVWYYLIIKKVGPVFTLIKMYAYKKNSIILKNNEKYLESKGHLRQL